MRRLARFLPFLLFGFVLLFCYFVLTSFHAPLLTQNLTYQDLDPSQSHGSGLRTATRTTTAYRKQIKLWEAQTSITFSYNGAQVVVTGARHEVHTYAPGWNALFTNPISHRNQDGTFQLKDTIQLWYGFFLFSRRYEFSASAAIHEFTLSPPMALFSKLALHSAEHRGFRQRRYITHTMMILQKIVALPYDRSSRSAELNLTTDRIGVRLYDIIMGINLG